MMWWGSHFNKAFKIVIGFEKGYVNDKADRGGETKYGISQRTFPNLDIANLTLRQAKNIYRIEYYDKVYDNFKQFIAIELFEAGVILGQGRAKRILQEALNLLNRNEYNFDDLVVDGLIGENTLYAYKKVNSKNLLKTLNGLQFEAFKEDVVRNPEQERFFNGWLQRV